MNNKKEYTYDILNKLYDKLSYFDKYGGSVILFIIITVMLFCIVSYFTIMTSMTDIKNNWTLKRCELSILPFAGYINKPDNVSISEYNRDNFNYCIQKTLNTISGYSLEPFHYITNSLTTLFGDINDNIQSIRTFMNTLRNDISTIATNIYDKISFIIPPLQTMFIALIDIFNKMIGVLTMGLMFALGTYYTLKSLLGSIIEMIVKILVILVIMIFGFWLNPFSFALAASTTAIFIPIAIALAIIIVFATQILGIHSKSVPHLKKKPKISCFDEYTLLKMNDNSYKYIKDIKVGDILENNNKVTATLILDSTNEIIYDINGILVSGSHSLYIDKNKKEIIKVKDYHNKIKVDEYHKPYLYCLNTEHKEIKINGILFCDWDELTIDKIKYIIDKNKTITNINNINKYLDKGWDKNENIRLYNKTYKQIKNIKIGDILDIGGKVYGIVIIHDNSVNLITEYNIFSIKGNIQFDYNNCIDKLFFSE